MRLIQMRSKCVRRRSTPRSAPIFNSDFPRTCLGITYNCASKDQLLEIVRLLDGYQGLYFALHATSRQSTAAWQRVLEADSDRVRLIRGDQIRRQSEVDPRLYLHGARRAFNMFVHDTDFFLFECRRFCSINHVKLLPSLVDQIDRQVLFGLAPVTKFDLSKLKPTSDDLEPIAHAFEKFNE